MISEIEKVLRRSMGLEASTIGAATVEQVVRARMAVVGSQTTAGYLQRLRDDPGELNELIESVVVPESWFFRDGAPFAALAHWVREHWLPAHSTGTLRVLTVPCSTGEESYSVAMTLLDAGLPPDRFMVDAVDISRRALARAQRAIYGANSFRGQSLAFRDRHFTPVPEGHALAAEVRRQVRFENGNLLAGDFRPGAGRFDVVFCRNLLIYFDRPTQGQAMRVLGRMLGPDGLLFVGHAETAVAAAGGFATANYPMSFAFRKATPAAPLLDTPKPPVTTILQRGLTPCLPRLAAARPPVTRPVPRRTVSLPAEIPRDTLSQPVASPVALETARILADQGKLEDASRLCEESLRQDGASAAAWYLLGVVREAAGDRRRAAECYTKTLYLEPNHEEALLHHALLAEQNGDLATAAQLRRRIVRVQERSARP